jgi:DNA-binding CsgD family transcriptional regulator
MLVLAVISDILHAKMESTTATQLAEMFYMEKDLDRAHQSIQLAQQSADYFNARHRKVRISKTLPLIETERILLEQDRRDRARSYSRIISSLALLTILFVVVIYMQLKRLRRSRFLIGEANRSLAESNLNLGESNAIKEKYIVDFLTSCANFIARADVYQKILRKKLREKNYEELSRLLWSDMVEEERQALFRRFDTIFLGLFPSFIGDFNALLLPGKEIVPAKNELLNTELRIYALMRLEIVDPSAVAKFLNCSLNTIYAYKTRINNRTRAADKKEFEKSIMQIGMFREG